MRRSYLLPPLVLAAMVVQGPRAGAGPAHYDPEARSIKLTYTYAALAENVAGDAAIGSPQKPTTEQDAKVRTIFLKVSDALSKSTAGRMKIASLDSVQEVKRADIVISLTGHPPRGGWAIRGAIEGQPGQVGLYYQTLADEWEQDFVLTAAHELCHYIFGFVDEYEFPSGCPTANPGGPGCLMDNYLSNGTRHGWYGRFCRADHFSDSRQPRSCQDIVEEFFRTRHVSSAEGVAEGSTSTASSAASSRVANTQAITDNIVRATIGKVREEAEARIKDRRGALLTGVTALRSVARAFLDAQLKQNRVGLSSGEVSKLVDGVLQQASSIIRVDPPPRLKDFVKDLVARAEERARELRKDSPRESATSRRGKIVRDLIAMLAGGSGAAAVGNAPPQLDSPPTAEERRYLTHIAMQATAKTAEEKLNDDLYNATLAHIKLSRETASNVLDMAGEVGVVGIENRLAAMGEVDADLRMFLPGRTASSGFGRRRTIVIDPDPLDPQFDYVVTQSGIYRYADLREEYVDLFQKLVQRAKVEILTTEVQRRRQQEKRVEVAKTALQRIRDQRLRRISELADPSAARALREADLRALLNELIILVRGNRIENIVFLAPPGSIPKELSPQFETLRRQLIIKADVRLDVVLFGPTVVLDELRDGAVATGGSVVTVADRDEIGAIAQRLMNDQTTGCWVTLPYQGLVVGPYYERARSSQAPVRWLLDDPLRGGFRSGPQPIDLEYQHLAGKLRCLSTCFPWPELKAANVLPPGAISLLTQAIDEGLNGIPTPRAGAVAANRAGEDDAGMGLLREIETIHGLVSALNKRNPGSGERIQFELMEHVIRARAIHTELYRLLQISLRAHEKLNAPDYDETGLFRDEYLKVLQEVEKESRGLVGWFPPTPQVPASVPLGPSLVMPAPQGPAPGQDGLGPYPPQGLRPPVVGAPVGPELRPPGSITGVGPLIEVHPATTPPPPPVQTAPAPIPAPAATPPAPRGGASAPAPSPGPQGPGDGSAAPPTAPRVEPQAFRPGSSPPPRTPASLRDAPPTAPAPIREARGRAAFRHAPNVPGTNRPVALLGYQQPQAGASPAGPPPPPPSPADGPREPMAPYPTMMGSPAPSPAPGPGPAATGQAPAGFPQAAGLGGGVSCLGVPPQVLPGLSATLRQYDNIQWRLSWEAENRYKDNPVTYCYLRLKAWEVGFRAVDDFLDHLERELAEFFDDSPLSRRIDRQSLVRANERIQDTAPGFVASVPGYISRPPLAPVDTIPNPAGAGIRHATAIRLPRFYAENQRFDPTKPSAEFELIVGLAKALPNIDATAIWEDNAGVLPRLRLYNDNGLPVETPSLRLDRDLSTPTCLVYRFSPEFGETGWYTAALMLNETMMTRLGVEAVNMTFSVASSRPNFRLTAALIQTPDDPELVPPPPRKGLVRAMDRRARVEVQVYGGTSVLGARLRGVLHKLDGGKEPILPIAQDFHDDGRTYGDKLADDGIYTTLVPLDQIATNKEYRLLIEADSTEVSKNIAPEDPGKNDEDRRKQARERGKKGVRAAPVEKVATPVPEKAVVFQRATSIQFRVQQ